MVASFPTENWKLNRTELVRLAALALVVILIWCTVFDRWTLQSWQTPLTYLETEPFKPDPPDVLAVLARIKGGSDGSLIPLFFSRVPQLGAPFVGNWNDFPANEKPLFCLAGLLANLIGLFAATNVTVLMGHVLAAAAFYIACRLMDGAWIWAFAGAVVFAFSRFAFAHGFNHLIIMYYWHVPLGLLVIEWVIRGRGLQFGDRRFVFAFMVAVLFGIQNPYFSYLFAQMVCLAGLVQVWRRGWRGLLPAVTISAATTVSAVLMVLNTLVYRLVYGPNNTVLDRGYRSLEIYGLKLVDLVMPPPDHRFSLLLLEQGPSFRHLSAPGRMASRGLYWFDRRSCTGLGRRFFPASCAHGPNGSIEGLAYLVDHSLCGSRRNQQYRWKPRIRSHPGHFAL